MTRQAPRPPVVDDDVRRQVSRAVERLCPSWLSADRDDIIQNTLLRLHQADPAGEGNAPVAASYIWRTAYTVMIDEIRRRGRRPEVPVDDTDSEMMRPGGEPSPEAVAGVRRCLELKGVRP